MKYRDFGKSGINVSELGFGAWAIGGNNHGISYGPVDDKDSILAIEKALALGCNYFDTADVYGWGHSEELLGSSLKSARDRVVIATKVGSDFYQGYGFQTFSEDYILFAFNKSLTRLKTDYIDVYQLHNPPLELISRPETFAIFKQLKKEGKIRAWGLSVTTAEEALAALEHVKPDCLQIPINIFSADSEMLEAVLPKAYNQGCALIGREPLANGFLSGKYQPNASFAPGDMRSSWPPDYVNARVKASQDLEFLILESERTMAQAALQWVLKLQELAVVIVGCKTDFQVKENFGVLDSRELSEEELDKISQLRNSNFGLK